MTCGYIVCPIFESPSLIKIKQKTKENLQYLVSFGQSISKYDHKNMNFDMMEAVWHVRFPDNCQMCHPCGMKTSHIRSK